MPPELRRKSNRIKSPVHIQQCPPPTRIELTYHLSKQLSETESLSVHHPRKQSWMRFVKKLLSNGMISHVCYDTIAVKSMDLSQAARINFASLWSPPP